MNYVLRGYVHRRDQSVGISALMSILHRPSLSNLVELLLLYGDGILLPRTLALICLSVSQLIDRIFKGQSVISRVSVHSSSSLLRLLSALLFFDHPWAWVHLNLLVIQVV
jgi:hypothetical protein